MEGSDRQEELLSTPSCLSFLADAVSVTRKRDNLFTCIGNGQALNVQILPNVQHDALSECNQAREAVLQLTCLTDITEVHVCLYLQI